MEDMLAFQNMDVSMELASLQFGIDFDEVNIFDGIHTPSPSDSLHFDSLMPNEQEQQGGAEVESSFTESGETLNQELGTAAGAAASLPITNTPVQDLAGVAWNSEVQVSGSTSGLSDNPTTVAISQVPVDPIPHVNAPTQPNLLTSLERLVSQETVPFLQAQLNYSNVLSSQNENITMPQGTGLPNQPRTNNWMLVQNMVAHNAFSGINQQQYPSYPSLIHQNPPEAGVGIRSTGAVNQAHFTCNQLPPTMWNSSWFQQHQCPPPIVYDTLYVPSCVHYDTPAIHSPQQFNTLSYSQHSSHVSGMRRIFDIQNCMHPPCPAYSRPESYSNYQPACAPVPPNAYDHRHVYRPMPLEPAIPTWPAMYSDYHPQPVPSATICNSFGAGPSMSPRYPELRDYQRNHDRFQTMMSNGFTQQALGPGQFSGPPRVSDNRNEPIQLWSTLNVQGHSSTVHGPTTLSRIAGSNVQNSRVAEPSQHTSDASNPSLLGFKTPEPLRLSWTQNAPGVQLQNVAPAATNASTAPLNGRSLENPSSSSKPQISEGVRKILNRTPRPKGPKSKAASYAPRTNAYQIQIPSSQDPEETWIKELEKELNRAWNQPGSLPQKQEESRRRRPSPEQHEMGESSSSKRQKLQKDSAGNGRDDKTLNSDEAHNTCENEGNEDQDANASEPSAVRKFLNCAYDTRFEKMGLPIDPHIRFFKAAEK